MNNGMYQFKEWARSVTIYSDNAVLVWAHINPLYSYHISFIIAVMFVW